MAWHENHPNEGNESSGVEVGRGGAHVSVYPEAFDGVEIGGAEKDAGTAPSLMSVGDVG